MLALQQYCLSKMIKELNKLETIYADPSTSTGIFQAMPVVYIHKIYYMHLYIVFWYVFLIIFHRNSFCNETVILVS